MLLVLLFLVGKCAIVEGGNINNINEIVNEDSHDLKEGKGEDSLCYKLLERLLVCVEILGTYRAVQSSLMVKWSNTEYHR